MSQWLPHRHLGGEKGLEEDDDLLLTRENLGVQVRGGEQIKVKK